MTFLTETKLHNVENEINYCLAHISNLQARLAALEGERLKLRDEILREDMGVTLCDVRGAYEVERG